MKKLIASLALAGALLPPVASAISLEEYEAQTQVAARFISGQLDARLHELGTNAQTGEYFPVMFKTQHDGVQRYCKFLSKALGWDSGKCDR